MFSLVKQNKVFLISFFSNLNYILPTHCSCSSFFLYLLSDEKWFFCLSASLLILFLSNPLILDVQERKKGQTAKAGCIINGLSCNPQTNWQDKKSVKSMTDRSVFSKARLTKTLGPFKALSYRTSSFIYRVYLNFIKF